MGKNKKTFEFSGEVSAIDVMGYEFRHNFSPSAPLDGMKERMEKRIKKIRKIRNNHIFDEPFRADDKSLGQN